MVLFLYLANMMFSVGVMLSQQDCPTSVFAICLFISSIFFFIADTIYDKDRKNKNT